MRIPTLALAGAVIAVLGLSSCSSGTGSATPAGAGSQAPAAAASASTADQASPSVPASKEAAPPDAGLPAKPDAATTAKLVAALDAIDKEIVGGHPDKAVENSRAQCQAIYNFPKDHAKLLELTEQRFTSTAHPSGFGPEKSEKILAAVQSTLCPRR